MLHFTTDTLAGAEAAYIASVQRRFGAGRAEKYDSGAGKVAWVAPEILVSALLPHVTKLLEERAENETVRLLDLGAGTGLVGQYLRDYFGAAAGRIEITGVDLSEDMLDVALSKGRIQHKAPGRLGEFLAKAKAGGEKFDIVTCCGVYDFLLEKEAKDVSTSIPSVLRDGGVFGLTYEPQGDEGCADIQHDPHNIRQYFQSAGADIKTRTHRIESAYISFKTQEPVPNDLLLGQKSSAGAGTHLDI